MHEKNQKYRYPVPKHCGYDMIYEVPMLCKLLQLQKDLHKIKLLHHEFIFHSSYVS